MKNIFNYLAGAFAAAALTLTACSPEEFSGANEAGVLQISDVAEAIDIQVDQETNQVTFTLNKAGCYPVWIFDGKNYSTTNGLQKIFTVAGDYSVEVKVGNANGISDASVTKTFHLNDTKFDFGKYYTFLAGTDSKDWYVARTEAKHMGCGPSGTDGSEWWSAQPNDKADWGVYDDVLTFTLDKKYTYNPGEGGTVYVNTGCSLWPEHNTNDGNDFMVPVETQTVDYELTVEGTDLFLELPAKTLFPYIPYDASYNSPRFKVESMNAKKMTLIMDNGDIAWRMVLTSEEPVDEPDEPDVPGSDVNWVDENSAANLWNGAVTGHTFWFANNDWAQIADPAYEYKEAENKHVLTVSAANGSSQWQGQFHIETNIATTAAKNYDFRLLLKASNDISGATVKLTTKEDKEFYFDLPRVDLSADEEYVYVQSNFAGKDLVDLKLALDFPGAAEGTVIEVYGIILQERYNPNFDYNAESNLWKSCTYENTFYYAPGWSQIADPTLEALDNGFKVTLPEATTDQWQAQVAFHTDLSTSADKQYDFHIVLKSTEDHPGVTVKLVLSGGGENDNIFYFADRHPLSAEEPYTLEYVKMPGIDMNKVSLFFDFGGCAAGTEVTLTDIILKESNE